MKSNLFSTLFLFISLNCLAQNWFPNGATWYFNQPSSINGNYVSFESKRDSIIQGYNVQVLEVKLNGSQLVSNEYIRQSQDSIFYFNINSNTFHLLYNFSANIGDTVIVHNAKFKPTKAFFSYDDSIANFKYKILSIDSIQISGNWLRRQKVTSLQNNEWGFAKPQNSDYYIIERIGSLSYLYGIFAGIIPEENVSILRCYNDINLTYQNPLWSQSCDAITSIEKKRKDEFSIFPNPMSNQLNIKLYEIPEIIEIYDIKGLFLFSLIPEKEMLNIDTHSLKEGVYFMRLKMKQNIYSIKLIKL